MNEKADLAPKRFCQLEQIFIGLDQRRAEQLEDAFNRAFSEKRKTETAADACFCGEILPREIAIASHIRNPRGLF